MASSVDLDLLYQILREVAREQEPVTYGELAEAYNARAQTQFGPHGVWDEPLGELNRSLEAAGYPPLSVVVVKKDTREPGGGFWGCCAQAPERPSDETERTMIFSRLLEEAFQCKWPLTRPRTRLRAAGQRPNDLVRALQGRSHPLRLDADNVARVGGTRVTLDTVVDAHRAGASPEEIARAYDVLSVTDVQRVVDFYLSNRDAVDGYLSERQQARERVRLEHATRLPTPVLRQRLLARRRKAS